MRYAAHLIVMICCLSLTFTPSRALDSENEQLPNHPEVTGIKPFVDIQDGKLTMGKLDKAQLDDGLTHLASVNDHHLEAGFGDGIVMDCQVVKVLPRDKYGQPSWSVRPIHIYSGAKQIHRPNVVLKSPTRENNGLELVAGKRYKLFALDIEDALYHKPGQLYFWGGVIPLK